MALGADALGCAKPQAKRVFSRSRRLLASYSGESPVQRAAILLPLHARRRRRWRQQFAGAEYGSRGLEGPLNLHSEPNPNDVAVGALMTVQVPEGLGPGSVFTVDVPGRGACRVTVPPGVFAGQTFTLLHPDYVGTSN